MKPDAYMPMYWAEFWAAVDGQPDNIILGYERAMSHYWQHNHCAGLRDDSEFLRRLCRIEREDWEAAMAIIFDNDKFFTLGEDNLWHQKRCRQEWDWAIEKYNKAVENGKLGGYRKHKRRRQ
jgi:uncharacterized protein YdaU (DUF1376 family)